jgi:hypothetical protein
MSWRCLSGLALALALLLSVPAGASPFDPNTDRRTATDYRTPRIQPPPPCPGALPVPGRHGQSTAAPGLWAISGKRTFARAYVYVGRGRARSFATPPPPQGFSPYVSTGYLSAGAHERRRAAHVYVWPIMRDELARRNFDPLPHAPPCPRVVPVRVYGRLSAERKPRARVRTS